MNTQTLTPTTSALPPGPAGLGFDRLRALSRDYLGPLRQWHAQYGDVVRQRFVHLVDYSFLHPDHIREVLVASHEQLIRWERGTEVFASAHGHSVLVAEGEAWQRQRQMLQPAFAPRRVESFVPRMVDAARESLQRWQGQPNFELDFDFESAMTQVTMEVIMRALFSRGDEQQGRAMAAAVHDLGIEAMQEFYWPVSAPLWMPWKARKRRALQLLKRFIEAEVDQRLARTEPREDTGADTGTDLLGLMLAAQDAQGQGFDAHALRDECMTTFLAGHETTAAALTWWGWCMASHPEEQRRVADELQAVLGERAPTAADLPQLPRLSRSFKESLRLYPPAAALFSRRTTAPVRVAGYTLPVGSMVRITPALTHRDPRWFLEPEAFRPDRFDPAAGHPEIPRGAWLPFGAGPRVCLGSHFALTEMSVIAALLLQRYELQTVPGRRAPQPRLDITLRPDVPLHLALKRR
ncbi:cytochrome P450 [Roseateles flavus]|uniref:cytochrome P450 n=1 Tax=Roseateles flavus TaxID=3149041 RepID=UPI003D336F00